MTEYLDVSTDIARRIWAGIGVGGGVVVGPRACRPAAPTTASTINRAYRCLAESGVIVLGE